VFFREFRDPNALSQLPRERLPKTLGISTSSYFCVSACVASDGANDGVTLTPCETRHYGQSIEASVRRLRCGAKPAEGSFKRGKTKTHPLPHAPDAYTPSFLKTRGYSAYVYAFAYGFSFKIF